MVAWDDIMSRILFWFLEDYLSVDMTLHEGVEMRWKYLKYFYL